ncbi:MAG: sigma-70 family RNA polymerase sigma factor [Acidobacteriota bacterium]
MVNEPIASELTRDLHQWSRGDSTAFERIYRSLFRELHRLARGYLYREGREHTLQATALMHEAYLRLDSQADLSWQNREQFIGVAARVMRRILVDYGRQRNAQKRGGERGHLVLDERLDGFAEQKTELLALDRALDALGRLDPQQARIVELRYFVGLTLAETASVLEVSVATVKREWTTARAWLHRRLASG